MAGVPKYGVLFFNTEDDRVDIVFEDGESHGGLHCGTGIEILLDDVWHKTRIEYSDDLGWYLVGMRNVLDGRNFIGSDSVFVVDYRHVVCRRLLFFAQSER